MNDFWKSYDITHAEYGADYRCYPLYGTVHLMELAISLAFIVGAALWYRRSSARTRRRILVGVTALLLLDEAALLLGMALTGQWNWSYLPCTCAISTSSSVCTTRSRTETGAKRSCMPSVSRVQCWPCSAPAGWMSPLGGRSSICTPSVSMPCWYSIQSCWWRAATVPVPGGCRRCWRSCSALPAYLLSESVP